MGGSQSTRKATFENETSPASVITISSSLAERVRGSGEPRESAVRSRTLQAPVDIVYLSSLQCKQEKEQELKKNDSYWEKRIAALESSHQRMNQIMEQEYNKGVADVTSRFANVPMNVSPPCQEGKKAVMECYKQHPNEPMRCAKEVQEFTECVDFRRAVLVSNRG